MIDPTRHDPRLDPTHGQLWVVHVPLIAEADARCGMVMDVTVQPLYKVHINGRWNTQGGTEYMERVCTPRKF